MGVLRTVLVVLGGESGPEILHIVGFGLGARVFGKGGVPAETRHRGGK